MYCKYCGGKISEDSIFCSHCGKNLYEKETVQDPQIHINQRMDECAHNYSPSILHNLKNKRYIIWCIILVLVALIVGIIYSNFTCKKISDITIDKVTPQLTKATKKYDELFIFHEGLAKVRKNDKYGFIDKLGQEIIPCKYDKAQEFENGISIVTIDNKEGVINQHGETLIPLIYEKIFDFGKDSTTIARLDGKEGIINIYGEVIIPFEYEECGYFHEGLAHVKKNGLYGFINRNNEIIIPCVYDEVDIFSEGLAAVEKNYKWGYIDTIGNVVIPFQEGLSRRAFESGLSTISRTSDNFNWNTFISNPSGDLPIFEWAFINKKGEVVSDFIKGEFGYIIDGRCVVRPKDKGFGLIDLNCNIIIPCQYSMIALLKESNYVGIYSNNKQGLADKKTGKIIIPCEYDYVGDNFHDGLVLVSKGGQSGFLNENNQTVIPFIYDGASRFSEGFAVVNRYGKDGYIDKYGNDTFN